MQALQWMLDNKEWLFSGIGVLIIAAVIERLRRRGSAIDVQRGGAGSQNLRAGRDINVSVSQPSGARPDEFHELSGIQMPAFRSDPVIGRIVQEEESKGSEFAIPNKQKLARKLAEGFEYLFTLTGQRCRYTGRGEELFLLVRRLLPHVELELRAGSPSGGVWRYPFIARLRNRTAETLSTWHVEVEIPTSLLNPYTTYVPKVNDRSDSEKSLFRNPQRPQPVLPGDAQGVLAIDLEADHPLSPGDPLLELPVIARAFINGAIRDRRETTIGNLLRESGVQV